MAIMSDFDSDHTRSNRVGTTNWSCSLVVELHTLNVKVVGSIPTETTIKYKMFNIKLINFNIKSFLLSVKSIIFVL